MMAAGWPGDSAESAPGASASLTPTTWLTAAGGLFGLGLLHWTVIVGQSASRGVDESPLAVAGFVALELLLLLPLLPIVRSQVRRFLSRTGPKALRLALHLAAALLVVVAYRAAVLSLALLVELGTVTAGDLVLWWRRAGPWQLQADLLVYAGLGTWFVVRHGAGRREPGASAGAAGESDGVASEPGGAPAERRAPIAEPAPAGERGAEWLTVPAGDTVHVVGVGEVRWIEGAGTYVRVHTDARSYLLRDTLESLAARLRPAGFVRVHRSAVVNLRHLESLHPAGRGRWTARLADGTSVRVAASRTRELEEALGDSLGG